jgi:guanine deaminase
VEEAAVLLPRLPAGTAVDRYPDQLVLPGLIDPHIHYSQTRVIGSYGAQLLDWLQKYTFVEEQKFGDPGYAAKVARFFLDELLRNGTTTAAVYCSVHPESVDAFFAEAQARKMRMAAGKVMMDRGAPPGLLDTAERGYAESRALLERWHGRDRLLYVITPRFAITSTDAQLEAAGALVREFPDALVQTHLCENRREIETVKGLFPWTRTYTGVYARYGLLGPRSLLGHCIHLEDEEVRLLAETDSVAVFCPTSNLFIGSGLFGRARLQAAGVRVALATDVGGGTSYSMLRTAAEAYKVLQLQGQNLPGLDAFRLMTRGNAAALGLTERIGSLEPGREADMVVLDARATPAMSHRMDTVRELEEELFVLVTLGDDRAVRATYVAGERLHAA